MNKLLRFAVLITILLLASTGTTSALSVLPVERSEYFGSWQGYSDSQVEFIRLELTPRGGGRMAILYVPNSSFEVYRVHWRQTEAGSCMLLIDAIPITRGAEAVSLQKVKYDMYALKLGLTGKGWKREFVLYNEKHLRTLSGSAKRAIFWSRMLKQ